MLVTTMLDFIKKEMKNKEFNEKIEKLEIDFHKDIGEYEDFTFKDVQNPLKCKNYNDLLSYVELTEQKKENRNNEYVKVLEMFMIRWIQEKSSQ